MGRLLKGITAAAARNELRRVTATPNYFAVEHTELVLALCRPWPPWVPPADAASAAGLSFSELFNTLDGHPDFDRLGPTFSLKALPD